MLEDVLRRNHLPTVTAVAERIRTKIDWTRGVEEGPVGFLGASGPVDLCPDAFGHGGHGGDVVAAQDVLQHVQLLDPVGVDLGLGEAEAAILRAALGQVLQQLASRRLDHPGPGHQVADPQVVAVEQREEGEHPAPDAAQQDQPGVHLLAARQQEGQGQVDLDLAHGVAGEDGVRRQPPPAPGRDPEPQRPLARRRRAGAQLEGDEIEVAGEEQPDQPGDADPFAGLFLSPRAHEGQQAHDGQRHHSPKDDGRIQQEGRGALGGLADAEPQIDPLGRDELAAGLVVGGRGVGRGQ